MSAFYAGKARNHSDDSARHYVNALAVRVSLSAIRFDLAALGAHEDDAEQFWRFVTTPSRLCSFHAGLGKAIDSYRTQFGEISSPYEDEHGKTESDGHG
ncbi:hypothetical protein [Novosphingobium beihaiensis]|uniref:Uncharacterized protein n=1 Tax=Novosphingobium beihaiensis TaxID=2930389 RepID=A0ABT0BN58_9SPHN|nr:hypothetical protein [Novosphingobium beihaiensis]MCJ2186485.1 hypothetical protein [Novosphingobium beihaiensis]